MSRAKACCCAQVVALVIFLLIISFDWPSSVGVWLFGAAFVSFSSGLLWLLVGPDDPRRDELPDLGTKSIDRIMQMRSLEISRDHLAGKHEPGTLLHQVCELSLEPEKMRKTFFEKYGKPIDDPQMSELRLSWEASWIRYRLEAEKIGLLGGLTYDRSGTWHRTTNTG